MLKSNFLILIGGLFLLVAWENRSPIRKTLLPLSLLTASLILAISPLITRNLIVGVPPLSLGSVTAVTLLIGNNPHADPWIHSFRPNNVAEIFSESQGAVLPTLVEVLKQSSLSHHLHLIAGKIDAIFHTYEAPNNTSYDLFRYYSQTLRLLPVGASTLFPLAAIGLLIAVRQRDGRCLALIILATTHLIPLLLVVVSSRFRVPLLFALIPFAAFTITYLISLARSRKYKTLGFLCLPILVLASLSKRQLPESQPRIPAEYWVALYETYYQPRINKAISDNNPQAIFLYTKELIQVHEKYLGRGYSENSKTIQLDIRTAKHFNRIRGIYALTLKELGRFEEGNAVYGKYLETQTMLNREKSGE
jgi:hypothetical protein